MELAGFGIPEKRGRAGKLTALPSVVAELEQKYLLLLASAPLSPLIPLKNPKVMQLTFVSPRESS